MQPWACTSWRGLVFVETAAAARRSALQRFQLGRAIVPAARKPRSERARTNSCQRRSRPRSRTRQATVPTPSGSAPAMACSSGPDRKRCRWSMCRPPPRPTTHRISATQTVAATTLFTASDGDGDPLTQYDFWDTGTGGAHWVINGHAGNVNATRTASAMVASIYGDRYGAGDDAGEQHDPGRDRPDVRRL